ncbi:MAG: beta-lactamase family protein [Methanobacteriota archaeon]|nr:MAG: beta-lactamase family protein [Euryarchaeota archaeon]
MTDSQRLFDRLDEYFAKRMAADNIPGMALAITDRRRTLHMSAMGLSDISSGARVTVNTSFQIGSISKSFTSIVLLKLMELGRLDIHAPLKEYLPWFEVKSKYPPITLHHLMTHTAGIPIGSECTTAAESEIWSLRYLETGAPPGEFFHYSNTGYKALGLVIEAVTGRPCSEAVSRYIVEPLEMKRTQVSITNDVFEESAVGYGWLHDDRPAGRKARLAPATRFESISADGSISSVPGDMAAYIRMILHRGEGPNGRIISEESFELLTGEHVAPLDRRRGEFYGYALNVEKDDGHKCIWHTGGMVGFTSAMYIDMDLGVGAIALANSLSGVDEMPTHALHVIRAAEENKSLPKPVIHLHAYVPENHRQFAGVYRSCSATLEINAEDGFLVAKLSDGQFVLEGLREDNFLLEHPSFFLYPLRFTRTDGEVSGLVHGPDTYVLEPCARKPDLSAIPEDWPGFVGHYRSHNPWQPSIRVVLREGQLVLVDPSAGEEPMQPLPDGSFRIGADSRSPERIRFDMVIGSKAYRAILSEGYLYRSFTP